MRRINNCDKKILRKNLAKNWKCDRVCPQETKLGEVLPSDMCSLWGFHVVDYVVLKAIGSSGRGGGLSCGVGVCSN